MTIAKENLPDDIDALKQIIADMARDAVVAQTEIARLQFQLARYRRAEFGRSSEKLARDIAQLELAIESVETDQAERLAAQPPVVAALIEAAAEAQKAARRPLPEHCRGRRWFTRRGAPARAAVGHCTRSGGRDRDARLCARPFQSNPPSARETRLPGL